MPSPPGSGLGRATVRPRGRLGPLERESSCFAYLNWRCDLARAEDGALLEAGLLARGWERRGCHPALRVLRRQDGSECAWLPSTGRVQVRVFYLVPKEERQARARELYSELTAALISSGSGRDAPAR